jgi:hypothetical protein
MDFKKFVADLAAKYRKPTEPTPRRTFVDVDATHEAGRGAGHEVGHAEGYEAGRKAGYEDGRADWHEAGYNKGYDEGFQMGIEAKTPLEDQPPESKTRSEPPGPMHSLYERLGGVYSIATVVEDFIDRIMIDPRLNANARVDEAHHRVPPAGFKYLVTEMLCWAAGGPQKYTGRSMKDSHQDLMITATDLALEKRPPRLIV